MGMDEEEDIEKWDHLSNNDEALDEAEIDPDFVIDRAPTPEFIPTEKGRDEQTQIYDYELFDFELEVEPVLQILVGKSCEQA